MPFLQLSMQIGNQSKGIRVTEEVVQLAFPDATPEQIVNDMERKIVSGLVQAAYATESQRIRQQAEAGIIIQD